MSIFNKEKVYTEKEIRIVIDQWFKDSNHIYDCLTPENKKWEPMLKLIIKMQYKTLLSYFNIFRPEDKDIDDDVNKA